MFRLANIFTRINRIWSRRGQLRLVPRSRRHDDLYLVGFPKSGLTWLSALIANIGLRLSHDTRRVTIFNLQDFVPDIHISQDIAIKEPLRGFGFRVIKSHSKYNAYYKKIFYLVRDPRDVMVSYWYFLSTQNLFEGRVSDLIRHPVFGIEAWAEHLDSWLSATNASVLINFIRYEDLKESPHRILKHFADLLGFEYSRSSVDVTLEEVSISRMAATEHEYSSYNVLIPADHVFVRKGVVGDWRAELSQDDLRIIEKYARRHMDAFGYR